MLKVVPIYASVLALLFIGLSIRTIKIRRTRKVGIGHGQLAVLERAIRVHANFAEYVPLAMILLVILELQQTWPWVLHLGGALLVMGRLSHAYGVSKVTEDYRFRVAGMIPTLAVIGVTALIALFNSFIRS
jgi:uncharacterized membrane protein YecN with MAPEG domain